MAYTNRNFTWDFDALKRFYEKYIVKWLNSAVSWTESQKKQARANLGFGDGDAIVTTADTVTSDLEAADENGNVIMQLKDGHIKTKNFDSANMSVTIADTTSADFSVNDENGNAVMTLNEGHIMTRNFDSKMPTLYGDINDINNKQIISLFGNFKTTRLRTNSNRQKSFVMVHFSDLHANSTHYLDRIEDFVEKYDDYIDLALHTGDLVKNFYNHPIYWNNSSKFLLTTGNHDCSWRDDNVTPYVWRFVERDSVYNNLFAPYISNWGVVRPDNATTELYYYKDYSYCKIRFVVLDPYYWDANQNTWLGNVLTDATTNGLSVILASHVGPFKGIGQSFNSFDSLDYDPAIYSATGFSSEALEKVKAFITGGGEVICWLIGHQHADSFRTDPNNPGILIIGVSAAGNTYNQEYRRIDGTKSEDLFNIYSIDTVKKRLTIVRIGADYDIYGRHKGTLVYDYANQTLITNN